MDQKLRQVESTREENRRREEEMFRHVKKVVLPQRWPSKVRAAILLTQPIPPVPCQAQDKRQQNLQKSLRMSTVRGDDDDFAFAES